MPCWWHLYAKLRGLAAAIFFLDKVELTLVLSFWQLHHVHKRLHIMLPASPTQCVSRQRLPHTHAPAPRSFSATLSIFSCSSFLLFLHLQAVLFARLLGALDLGIFSSCPLLFFASPWPCDYSLHSRVSLLQKGASAPFPFTSFDAPLLEQELGIALSHRSCLLLALSLAERLADVDVLGDLLRLPRSQVHHAQVHKLFLLPTRRSFDVLQPVYSQKTVTKNSTQATLQVPGQCR